MDGFIGEIKAFTFEWAPMGWLPCDGKSYSIDQYPELYALLGNTYGGTDKTFNVPNLQGRIIINTDPNDTKTGSEKYKLGSIGGTESVALGITHVPPHSHTFNAATTKTATYLANETQAAGNGTSFISNVFEHPPTGQNRLAQGYHDTGAPNTPLAQATITPFSGGTAPHENRQPYFVLNYCINWWGSFPSM